MGVTINNESTTNLQQQNHRLRTDSSLYLWDAKIASDWYQIFALESAVVEAQKF